MSSRDEKSCSIRALLIAETGLSLAERRDGEKLVRIEQKTSSVITHVLYLRSGLKGSRARAAAKGHVYRFHQRSGESCCA